MARKRYWEEEQPAVVTTGRNVLRFYREAGRLQVAKPDWQAGTETRMGKAVTLDLAALAEAEPSELATAVSIFGEIARNLESAALAVGGGPK